MIYDQLMDQLNDFKVIVSQCLASSITMMIHKFLAFNASLFP